MTHEQLEAEVAKLAAQRLIARDIIGWLVANFAGGEADPGAYVRAFAEGFSSRIAAKVSAGTADLTTAETMQTELDGIVGIVLGTLDRGQLGA